MEQGDEKITQSRSKTVSKREELWCPHTWAQENSIIPSEVKRQVLGGGVSIPFTIPIALCIQVVCSYIWPVQNDQALQHSECQCRKSMTEFTRFPQFT